MLSATGKIADMGFQVMNNVEKIVVCTKFILHHSYFLFPCCLRVFNFLWMYQVHHIFQGSVKNQSGKFMNEGMKLKVD